MEDELNRNRIDGPLRTVIDSPAARGLQFRVRRFWREDDGCLLVRLDGPYPQDLEIVWAGSAGGEGILFVLEAEPFDLDDERYVQIVFGEDIAGAVRAIGQEELDRLEGTLRAAAAARPGLDLEAVERSFGIPLRLGSPEWIAASLADLGLRHGLLVRHSRVPPGTRLGVDRLENPAGDPVVRVESPRHADSCEEYRLANHLEFGGAEFVVLVPRDRPRPSEDGARYLVGLVAGGIEVLDASAFEGPARALAESLEGGRGRFAGRLGRLSTTGRARIEQLLPAPDVR